MVEVQMEFPSTNTDPKEDPVVEVIVNELSLIGMLIRSRSLTRRLYARFRFHNCDGLNLSPLSSRTTFLSPSFIWDRSQPFTVLCLRELPSPERTVWVDSVRGMIWKNLGGGTVGWSDFRRLSVFFLFSDIFHDEQQICSLLVFEKAFLSRPLTSF
jgi:hypothetical protein